MDYELTEEEMQAEAEADLGEVYAEFVMSWVAGGGFASDADRAWRSGIAWQNGYWGAPQPQDDDWGRPTYGTPEWEANERALELAELMDEGGF
jgi:hypothetical protein